MTLQPKENLDKKLQHHQAKINDLFNEIVEIITDNFVATYKIEDNAIIMRILNGQKFRILVEEIT